MLASVASAAFFIGMHALYMLYTFANYIQIYRSPLLHMILKRKKKDLHVVSYLYIDYINIHAFFFVNFF